MRIVSLGAAVLLLLGAGCGRLDDADRGVSDLLIRIEQKADGPWDVAYELDRARSVLDLGRDLEGFRAQNWKIETEGVVFSNAGGRDLLVSEKGRNLPDRIKVSVTPAPSDFRKDYDPFISMGDGGVLFYTGHFIPLADDKRRLPARLTVVPSPGAAVSAFGETKDKFEDWESPYNHPAFIYVGKTNAATSEAMSAITDSAAPAWIVAELAGFAPAIANALHQLLERALPAPPNVFVAMGDLSEEGRLSYSGDALPGQFQMTLAGGAWKAASVEAVGVLRRSTAHEAAHLWQAATRPKSDAVPGWIHEGGANALAAEALVAAGYWSKSERDADFAAARAQCERTLTQLSLQRAESEGLWDGVYACGQVVNVAAAGKKGAASFWSEFVGRTARTGYDEADFLALAEERAGPDVARAIRDLARINDARPDLVIDRMLP